MNMDTIVKKARTWLNDTIDKDTQQKVKHLIAHNQEELTECFYKNLEFGTGGLRGIMGVGSNRMNKYTVGMATQGLANYLNKVFPTGTKLKAAIAYDTRNNSRFFAQITAEVLSANNVEVYLFDDIRPTPLLSYAVRKLQCHTGIVITASHNPKEYNGYKVYWEDGGQLVAPHDKNIMGEVNAIENFADVNFNKKQHLIHSIGDELDKAYISQVKQLSFAPDIIAKHKDLKIVFTPIHGTAVHLVPACLKAYGFNNVHSVEAQNVADGNFPTVEYPNPEEAKALQMALEEAEKIDATLVMGTDPDADRVGIAVKNTDGKLVLLNGNQTASILIYYLLNKWHEEKKLSGKEFTVKTIVTTELLTEIARHYNVEQYDVLTGFKFIAEIIKKNEGHKKFIAGGEESYGYLVGDFVRDKDAVISCCIIAEAAAWAASQNMTLYELLLNIYLKFGFYKEHLISITKKGKSGSEEIALMMKNYRSHPPKHINKAEVVRIKDYLSSTDSDTLTGTSAVIELPKSNVLQFFLNDGSKITIRPSGTEPKIKFYFSVHQKNEKIENYDTVNAALDKKINNIIQDMGLK